MPDTIQWLAKATSNAKPKYLYLHPDGKGGLIATDGYRIHHCISNPPTVPPEYVVPDAITAALADNPFAAAFAELLATTHFSVDVRRRLDDFPMWHNRTIWRYVELPALKEQVFVDADYWQDAISALPARRRTVDVALGYHTGAASKLPIYRVTLDRSHVAYLIGDTNIGDLKPMTARIQQLFQRYDWLSDMADEAYEAYLNAQTNETAHDAYARLERIRRLVDKTKAAINQTEESADT